MANADRERVQRMEKNPLAEREMEVQEHGGGGGTDLMAEEADLGMLYLRQPPD